MKYINKIIILLIIKTIKIYQYTISPDHGFLKKIGIIKNPVCVFYPTCSEYSIEVFKKYGIFKGLYKTVYRVCRCHPKQKKHIDLP